VLRGPSSRPQWRMPRLSSLPLPPPSRFSRLCFQTPNQSEPFNTAARPSRLHGGVFHIQSVSCLHAPAPPSYKGCSQVKLLPRTKLRLRCVEPQLSANFLVSSGETLSVFQSCSSMRSLRNQKLFAPPASCNLRLGTRTPSTTHLGRPIKMRLLTSSYVSSDRADPLFFSI